MTLKGINHRYMGVKLGRDQGISLKLHLRPKKEDSEMISRISFPQTEHKVTLSFIHSLIEPLLILTPGQGEILETCDF